MISKARILVVDDESSMRSMVSILLKRHGYEAITANSGEQAVRLMDSGEEFDLVITDLLMDRGGGLEVLKSVKERDATTEVIVITAFGTAETAVEAMKQGAFDYIAKPFNVDEFVIIVRQALERRKLIRDNMDLRARVRGEYKFADVVGRSDAMNEVMALCRKVADSPATVLLTGESGTGKEVVARALHFSGPRADKPFVAVNCGALPEQLMESELFGHVKGSFTGAIDDKMGLIPSAEGGTVFLDEVGELPMPLQVKLLRVLEDRRVRPVGASEELSADIRVMAATNRDLSASVKAGEFRTDLYYRLNVLAIRLPPLRERREDVPLLVEHLLKRLAAEHGGGETARVATDAMRLLVQYNYPGNVRELANILERAVTLASCGEIGVDDLPLEVRQAVSSESLRFSILPKEGINLDSAVANFERSLIEQALERAGGVRTKAAAILGISFRSFRYRLSKLGLSSDEGGDE